MSRIQVFVLGSISRRIRETVGLEVPLERISSSVLQRPAARPRFSALESRILRLDGYESLPDWEEALKQYLAGAAVAADS